MRKTGFLVLGGAHVDRRGRIVGETAPGASNPGRWFVEAGGGGFNAARNLARLGHRVRLISPRGGDSEGALVEAAALAAGVEDTPFTFLDRTTPSYTAILERDGNLVVALADMDLYRYFTPRRLSGQRAGFRLVKEEPRQAVQHAAEAHDLGRRNRNCRQRLSGIAG